MNRRRTNPVKTLAIRLEDDAHARLALLSKLSGLSITDTIRTAIDGHLAALAAQPDIAAKAEALTSEIEREAAEQRSAIQALLGSSKPATRQPKG
jgi:predicted DNA-binding protein